MSFKCDNKAGFDKLACAKFGSGYLKEDQSNNEQFRVEASSDVGSGQDASGVSIVEFLMD